MKKLSLFIEILLLNHFVMLAQASIKEPVKEGARITNKSRGAISDSKFALGLNVGYTLFVGPTKTNNGNLVDYSNGLIPIGLQLRYALNNNIFFNVDYSYAMGVAKTENFKFPIPLTDNVNFGFERRNTMNANQFVLGFNYILHTIGEYEKFKPYIGLDFGFAKWSTTISTDTSISTSFSPSTLVPLTAIGLNSVSLVIVSNSDISRQSYSLMISPKIGFDYDFNNKLFLNFKLSYVAYTGHDVEVSTTNNPTKFILADNSLPADFVQGFINNLVLSNPTSPLGQYQNFFRTQTQTQNVVQKQDLSSSIAVGLGIGYRF